MDITGYTDIVIMYVHWCEVCIPACLIYLTCLYPCILISLGSCALACILASAYPYVRAYIVSSHPYILMSSGSYALAYIPASLYP